MKAHAEFDGLNALLHAQHAGKPVDRVVHQRAVVAQLVVSYSSLADQTSANAHSTPPPAVQPKRLSRPSKPNAVPRNVPVMLYLSPAQARRPGVEQPGAHGVAEPGRHARKEVRLRREGRDVARIAKREPDVCVATQVRAQDAPSAPSTQLEYPN